VINYEKHDVAVAQLVSLRTRARLDYLRQMESLQAAVKPLRPLPPYDHKKDLSERVSPNPVTGRIW
jgi:antitoxin (DNA-binding transcriptional repressor) of toxin-antitoxin stability system